MGVRYSRIQVIGKTNEEIASTIVISFANIEYLVSWRQILGRSSLVKHGRGQLPVEPAVKSASIFSAITLWPAWLATFVFNLSDEIGVSLL